MIRERNYQAEFARHHGLPVTVEENRWLRAALFYGPFFLDGTAMTRDQIDTTVAETRAQAP